MKTIIAATDFSPVSQNAVLYAAAMARATSSRLVIMNAYDPPKGHQEVLPTLVPVEEVLSANETQLEKIRKKIPVQSTPPDVRIVAAFGNIADVLHSETVAHNTFAVVIGTRGAGSGETAFGSETLAIIRRLSVPVICVPPGRAYGHGIHRLGLACDLKDVDETLPAEMIKSFMQPLGAELHVLNVDYKNRHFLVTTPHEEFVMEDRFMGHHPIYHFLEGKNVQKSISASVSHLRLDAVITIPKKHSIMEQIFRKSTTRTFVEELPAVLICMHN